MRRDFTTRSVILDMREVGFKPGVMVMVRVVIQQREKMPYRSKKRQDRDTETGKGLTARARELISETR